MLLSVRATCEASQGPGQPQILQSHSSCPVLCSAQVACSVACAWCTVGT